MATAVDGQAVERATAAVSVNGAIAGQSAALARVGPVDASSMSY